MFILFDTTSARSAAGGRIKDPEVATRVDKKQKGKETDKKGEMLENATV